MASVEALESFLVKDIPLSVEGYGVYSAIARRIIIAVVSDWALQFIFAKWIGIYLVSTLSVTAWLKSGVRSIWRGPRFPSEIGRTRALFMFFLAFMCARGLDILLTTFWAARQDRLTVHVALVTPANTQSRPFVSSAFGGVPVNRSATYMMSRLVSPFGGHAAMPPIFAPPVGLPRFSLHRPTSWPQVVGALSEVEVAAVALANPAFDSPCAWTQEQFDFPANRSMCKVRPRELDPRVLGAKSFTLFNEELLFLDVSVKNGDCGLACSLAVPASIGLFNYDVQSRDSSSSSGASGARLHSGVLLAPDGDLVGYQTRCGLPPAELDRWFTEQYNMSLGSGRRTTLRDPPEVVEMAANASFPKSGMPRPPWYLEYLHPIGHASDPQLTNEPETAVALLLMSSITETDTFDCISVGGKYSTEALGQLRASVITPSLATGNPQQRRNNTSEALFLDQQPPPVDCVHVPTPYTVIDPAARRFEQRKGATISKDSQAQTNRQCSLQLNRTRNVTFFHDPTHHQGAQICRTVMQVFRTGASTPMSRTKSDFVTAFRMTNTTKMLDQRLTAIECVQPTTIAARKESRVGYVSTYFTEARRKLVSAGASPDDPQLLILSNVNVTLLEVWILSFFVLYLLVAGSWGNLAEAVTVILYAFAYRPPPTTSDPRADTQSATLLSEGLAGIPLLEPTCFAAMRLDGVDDSSQQPVVEPRLVPKYWHVRANPPTTLCLTCSEHGSSATNVQTACTGRTETVVVKAVKFTQFLQEVQGWQMDARVIIDRGIQIQEQTGAQQDTASRDTTIVDLSPRLDTADGHAPDPCPQTPHTSHDSTLPIASRTAGS